MVNVWQLGGLQITIYENPDFTGYVDSFMYPSSDIVFNSTFHSFFAQRVNAFSVTLQGQIRTNFNNLYNFTVRSNEKLKIYLDRKLVIDKVSQRIDEVSYIREMYIN